MYLFFNTETIGLPKNWKAPVTDLKSWNRNGRAQPWNV